MAQQQTQSAVGSNQWRKNKFTLAHQLQASTNSNHNQQQVLRYRQQHQYVHQHQHQHQHQRPNQWRNPNGNGYSNNNNSNTNSHRNPNAIRVDNNKYGTNNGNGNGNEIQMRRNHNHTRNHNHNHNHFEPNKWLSEERKQRLNELTASLHDTLHKHGVFEHGEGSKRRLNVLNHLERSLNQWSDSLNSKVTGSTDTVTEAADGTRKGTNNDPTDAIAKSRVRLISFGSYRLGVHAPSADLDLLALCPPHVTREEFFSTFVTKLNDDDRCACIHPIPGAYTPVIKFEIDGIPIDMLFVRLIDGDSLISDVPGTKAQDRDGPIDYESDSSTEHRRTEFQIEDGLLNGLDEPSSRSLNGVRVAQYLLDIIPNKKTFRLVLKTIKEWAEVHGLYSNVLGFLGGINWAILVAWVCKRYPEASPPVLLKIFFHTFSRWNWPSPVTLTKIVNNPPQGLRPLTVWNPAINPRDRAQIMPIITPCYPSMNSSYNVAKPQLRRLREELHRADKIIDQIPKGNAQWSDLLKENDFFKDHVHYLQVNIIAKNQEDHRAWFGLCESRLRILIAGLDSAQYGTQAYPFTKFFTRKEKLYVVKPKGPQEGIGGLKKESSCIVTSFFIALRFAYGVENADLIDCTAEYSYTVNSWEDRKPGMDLDIGHVLQKDLPGFVFRGTSSSSSTSHAKEAQDRTTKKKHMCPTMDRSAETIKGPKKNLQLRTVLNDGISPDDCLASPMKRAKISRA